MTRFKAYVGSDIAAKYYKEDNNSKVVGIVYPVLDPSTLDSLQIWFDPVENTITTDGSGNVTQITNSGNAGNTFGFYPDTSTFDPAKTAQLVSGSGNTKIYTMDSRGNGGLRIADFDTKTYNVTGSTVISICRVVEPSSNKWSFSWSQDPDVTGNVDNIRHPEDANGLDFTMDLQSSGGTNEINPSSDIGQYVSGSSDFTLFAATVPNGDWINNSDSIKFQSSIENQVTTTESNPYDYSPSYYNRFVIHTSGNSLSPGFGNGRDDYAAVMVFDEVLTEEQIGGIYRYYRETRGYSMV